MTNKLISVKKANTHTQKETERKPGLEKMIFKVLVFWFLKTKKVEFIYIYIYIYICIMVF